MQKGQSILILYTKKILCLGKNCISKNDYNSAEWGNAIRYGKFAVLSAYVAQYRDEEWSEENITQRLMELLSQWKAFESFVKTKESNQKILFQMSKSLIIIIRA